MIQATNVEIFQMRVEICDVRLQKRDHTKIVVRLPVPHIDRRIILTVTTIHTDFNKAMRRGSARSHYCLWEEIDMYDTMFTPRVPRDRRHVCHSVATDEKLSCLLYQNKVDYQHPDELSSSH